MMKTQASIIIPCYNEERYIRGCLESIVENDYSKESIEVLVIDGCSKDKSRQIVEGFLEEYPFIRLLDNPQRIVPIALNIGISQAKGKIIMIIGAHATYPKDYLSKLVYWLEKNEADCVGGICMTMPGKDTLMARAIALSLSSTFGVGNAKFRTVSGDRGARYVDTVPYGAYTREVFKRIGLFDERLKRNQDIEFNKRLIKAGGKILLIPEIISYYHARPTLKALWMNNFANGLWVIYAAWFTKNIKSLSLRHFIPLAFISGLFASLVLTFFTHFGKVPFIGILGGYFSLALFFSGKFTFKNGLRCFPILLIVFLTLHLSYGLGSLWGLLKILTLRRSRLEL